MVRRWPKMRLRFDSIALSALPRDRVVASRLLIFLLPKSDHSSNTATVPPVRASRASRVAKQHGEQDMADEESNVQRLINQCSKATGQSAVMERRPRSRHAQTSLWPQMST